MTIKLLDKTRTGMDKFCMDTGYTMPNTFPEWAAFWFRLRVAPDKPEWFPSGKWGTLQSLSDRLEHEAKNENL